MFSLKKLNVKKEVRKIKKEDFKSSSWADNDTFYTYIDISKKLQKLLDADIGYLYAEYWKDAGTFHYLINNGDELKDVIEETPAIKLNCKHLDNLFMEVAKAQS